MQISHRVGDKGEAMRGAEVEEPGGMQHSIGLQALHLAETYQLLVIAGHISSGVIVPALKYFLAICLS